MRESREKEIDGLTFTVQKLPGMRAQKMLIRLLGILGPAFGKLGPMITAVKNGGGLDSIDVELLAPAFERLTEKLSPDEYEAIYKELLETALVTAADGKTVPLMKVHEEIMSGRVFTGLKLFAFALQVNFADFLDGSLAGAFAARVQSLAASKTSSKPGPVDG